MQKLTDEEIIYNALCRYPKCSNGKKLPPLSRDKILSSRAQFMQQVDKYILFWKSANTTIVEKEKLCNKGKNLYRDYCAKLKVYPSIDTAGLAKRMDEILHYMASYEASKLGRVRSRQIGGGRIDLESIFAEDKNVRILVAKPIDTLIEENFENKAHNATGAEAGAIYMTAKGAKYHRQDCPYCKGKMLVPTSLKKAQNIGLTPCKCMEQSEETGVAELVDLDKKAKEKSYVTAFVDESIRINPWRVLDMDLPQKQACYSYIICKGLFAEETYITEKNTWFTGVMKTPETVGTNDIAIEAILAVLLRLLANGYRDNVVIYTDNQAAKDSWNKSPASCALANVFASVVVCYVPREGNTKADALGRNTAFVELPIALVNELARRSQNYEQREQELNFVKSYFPVPRQNIPNLMMELKALAEAVKGGQ